MSQFYHNLFQSAIPGIDSFRFPPPCRGRVYSARSFPTNAKFPGQSSPLRSCRGRHPQQLGERYGSRNVGHRVGVSLRGIKDAALYSSFPLLKRRIPACQAELRLLLLFTAFSSHSRTYPHNPDCVRRISDNASRLSALCILVLSSRR